jgi:2-polyprenyl-3-methyl-5-hydroxy-6-metoxy-1,4-benzoquinol methylase
MTKRILLASIAFAALALIVLLRSAAGSHRILPRRETHPRQSSAEYLWENASPTSDHARLFSVVDDYLKGLPAGALVADLGCGNGAFLSRLRGRGWTLAGIDLSTSGIAIARRQWPDIRFEVADATADLAFLGYGTFDAVISTDVVEHVFLPRLFAANCFRLLKPGGTIVISTPYHGYAKNLCIALTNEWDRHHDPLWDYGHIKFWSVPTLSELLFESGFQDLEWRGVGRFPLFWNEMVIRASVPPH